MKRQSQWPSVGTSPTHTSEVAECRCTYHYPLKKASCRQSAGFGSFSVCSNSRAAPVISLTSESSSLYIHTPIRNSMLCMGGAGIRTQGSCGGPTWSITSRRICSRVMKLEHSNGRPGRSNSDRRSLRVFGCSGLDVICLSKRRPQQGCKRYGTAWPYHQGWHIEATVIISQTTFAQHLIRLGYVPPVSAAAAEAARAGGAREIPPPSGRSGISLG